MSNVWSAAAAAAVSLGLGLYQLGQPSLWIDEAATSQVTSRSYLALMHEHHWIYYTVMKLWVGLVGSSEVALRLPSVLAAAGACALLVPFGNRLLGRPVGSIAGLLLAVNPFVVQWSQQARSYSIVVLATIVTTWLFVRMRADESRRAWLTYTVCLGAFLLLQPLSAGLLAVAHLLAARGFRTRVAMAGAVVVLVGSPFLVGVGDSDVRAGTIARHVDPTIGSVSHALVELSGALGVGLLLALASLAWVRGERLLLAAWAFAPLAISVAVTPVGTVFIDRYVIVSTPAFALLVAALVARLRRRGLAVAVAALAAGTVAGLALWYGMDGSQNWRGEDWKSATRYAMKHGGARVYPYWAANAYRYYGGVERNTGLYLLFSDDPGDFAGDWHLDVSFGARLHAQRR